MTSKGGNLMRLVKTVCSAAIVAACLASGARADEWNKKTYLTFSGPVQIPGATLQGGTYMFQLADPDNARHVVMVSSKEGDKVYGMFMTIPNERLEVPDQNVIMFAESPAGTPQAVQAWFYPGDRIGEEFVYPKNQAAMIAKANHREVLATYEDVNAKGSESERMTAIRGSKVGRIDESGAMKNEMSNTAQSTTAQSTTARSSTPAAEANKPATTTAPAATTTAPSAATTTASNRPAATTAPANTVNGRDSNGSARSNAVGTSGQAPTTATNTAGTARRPNRDNLPRTASDLTLIELLSGLSIAGGLTLRGLRKRTAHA
jgi:hypothetical protein